MDIAEFNQEMNLSSPSRGDKSARTAPAVQFPPFIPRRGLSGAHLQTIVSHFLRRQRTTPAPERRLIQVEPEVKVLCLSNWQRQRQSAITLVIVHGLEGSSEAQYVLGTADKAWNSGMNVVRMNVRNCGGTDSLTPTLYHSGMSDDIDAVVRELIRNEQLTKIAIAGFSMGGNQVLKLAGEWGAAGAPPEVVAVAAVSPAMDLSASSDALHKLSNRIYELNFLVSLRARVRRKIALFPDRYHVSRLWWRSVRDFDNLVTAPHCGFKNAEDYYQRASSSRVLDKIAVPTLIIHAEDDPFIRVLPKTRVKILSNPHITYLEPAHGGHCGFLAAAHSGYDGRWAEQQVVKYVLAQARRSSAKDC